MADKSFGVKDINLIGASGTPEIESPNNLNINAVNVAISTDMSVGGELTVADKIIHTGDTNTAIRFPATDTVTVETNGSESLRITSTGQLQATGAADVRLTLGSSGTAGTNDSVHIRADSANLSFMNGNGGITKFESNGTETLRIDSTGNTTFSGNITLGTDLVVTAGSNAGSFWKNGGNNLYGLYLVGDGIMWRSFDTSKKLIGRVGSTGGVQLTNGSTSWSAYVSESRLKDIISDTDKDQCWNLVRDLELKRYFYKDNDEEFRKGTSYMGPMADWIEKQDPELVIYNDPDEEGPIRTYNQGLLEMKALQALSTALTRIETLEAKVAALEG